MFDQESSGSDVNVWRGSTAFTRSHLEEILRCQRRSLRAHIGATLALANARYEHEESPAKLEVRFGERTRPLEDVIRELYGGRSGCRKARQARGIHHRRR